tara:strand:+ start:3939 stop:4640 length:702 start_codon:yes stop_codon:yes gene_type:complete
LNRRNLEENFLQVASEMNNVKDYSLARKTVRRVDFRQGALHEFYTNKSTTDPSGSAISLTSNVSLLPQTIVPIECNEYGEYLISWSLEVAAGEFSLLCFNAVVNGQNVGQGSYAVELPYKYSRISSGSVWAEEENNLVLEDTMVSSGSSTPTGTAGPGPENPFTEVRAYDHADPYRCLPERVSGQCQVSMDQGVSYFGIQVASSENNLAERIAAGGAFALVTYCTVVVNRVVR